MTSSLSSEVICGWNSARALCQEWNELEQRIGVEHPFWGFSWLDCWINAYVNPQAVHVFTVRLAGELRAVLPLVIAKKQIACFHLNTYAFPGNGHSPRGGLLAAPDDHAALVAVGKALLEKRSRFSLCLLPAVPEKSATCGLLDTLSNKGFVLHQEHTFDVPCFSLPMGWSKFVETKSKKFRKRLRESRAIAEKIGLVRFEALGPGGIDSEILYKLQAVDRKSWQHANNSGLFSTHENAAFYEKLTTTAFSTFNVFVALLSIDAEPVAYQIAVCRGDKAYFLKYGFDPAFAQCRPGVLIQAALSEYVAQRGVTLIDLGPEVSDEKTRWESCRLPCINYWLINRKTVAGGFLSASLKIKPWLKSNRLTAFVAEGKVNLKEYEHD